MNIKKINQRLLINHIKSQKTIFTLEEIHFIQEELCLSSNVDSEETKLAYLILNVENNLSKETKNNIRSVLSMINLDLKDSNTYISKLLSSLISSENTDNFEPTFRQQPVFNSLNSNKSVLLIAGTGFGKTTIFYRHFNKIMESQSGDDLCVVICVPTELLEEQLIIKLQNLNSNLNIGNNIYKNNFLILTPEKLHSLIKIKTNIRAVLFDEAHGLLVDNDDRSLFALEVMHMVKNTTTATIHFATPFLNDNQINKFKSEIKEIHVFQFLDVHSSSKRAILMEDYQGYLDTNDNIFPISEKPLENKMIMSGVTLVYDSGKNKVMNHARNSKADFSNLQKLIKNNEKYEEYKNNIDELSKKYSKYVALITLKNGVGYFHSDMPPNIKVFIMWCIEHAFINKVYATNSILNGIDLPFTNVVIKNPKISRKKMTVPDFMNLVGRAGRWSDEKRTTAFSFSIVERDENGKNLKWFNKNKEKIHRKKWTNTLSYEGDDIFFVKESLKKYKETNDERYKYDLRINPKMIDIFSSKKLSFDDSIIERVFYEPYNHKESQKMIKEIFEYYHLNDYDNLYREDNNQKDEKESVYKKMILSAATSFFKCNTVEKSMNSYIRSKRMMEQTSDKVWTESFERRYGRVKKYGKHYLFMFLNHYMNLSKFNGKLEKYLTFKTVDDDLIDFINENNLKGEWVRMVHKDQKRRFDPRLKTMELAIKNLSKNKPLKAYEEYSSIIQAFKKLKE